jgi:hypothetical protein
VMSGYFAVSRTDRSTASRFRSPVSMLSAMIFADMRAIRGFHRRSAASPRICRSAL